MSGHRGAAGARGRFTQVANDAIRDESLSPLASHIIAFVLSYPEDHRFTQDWLRERLLRRPGVTAHAIKVAMAELTAGGYYIKNRTSGGKGTWLWEQIITDTPSDFAAENQTAGETPTSMNQVTDETACDDTVFPQVSSSVNQFMDEPASGKELKTLVVQDLKTKDENRSAREDEPPLRGTVVDGTGPMTDMIISEIEERTRVRIDRDHAAQVARQILGRASSPPRKPLVFVRAAIRHEEDPRNFLPTPTPPAYKDISRSQATARAQVRESRDHLTEPASLGQAIGEIFGSLAESADRANADTGPAAVNSQREDAAWASS